ncbi:MAG: hypothetical protein HY913_15315 [Desulfomonile tiedjei]|nr:hypothetical protein [Desulfomonile tiedjei]
MKKLKGVLLISVMGIFLASTAPVNADTVTGSKATRTTVYNAKEKCQVICKAPKPILEVLEDGLAFVLDIPLAMLSPITCPVVSAITDEDDASSVRRHRRSKK